MVVNITKHHHIITVITNMLSQILLLVLVYFVINILPFSLFVLFWIEGNIFGQISVTFFSPYGGFEYN